MNGEYSCCTLQVYIFNFIGAAYTWPEKRIIRGTKVAFKSLEITASERYNAL